MGSGFTVSLQSAGKYYHPIGAGETSRMAQSCLVPPTARIPVTHPRCSVWPSAWKSTSCPLRSWPTAVLADITFTNLLKEPEGEGAWLVTQTSRGPSVLFDFFSFDGAGEGTQHLIYARQVLDH